MSKYPSEFLGRCQTCLENANLSSEPCQVGGGNGMPRRENDCLVRVCQEQYDRDNGSNSGKVGK